MDKINHKELLKGYDHCFECGRLLDIKFLSQVPYFNGHLIKGSIHHKTICQSCKRNADNENLKIYGNCINCGRLLPFKYLERILYYKNGKLSNELLCPACKIKSKQVFGNKDKILINTI